MKRLAVDIGGTFTDVVLDVDGVLTTLKVLTTPSAPEKGVLEGVAAVLEAANVGIDQVELMLHGTTLATNAIIERKGAPTALITTEGFRDVVEIGYESRYDQYDIFLEKPVPLVPRYLRYTVPERLDRAGNVLRPLDEASLAPIAEDMAANDITSVAVGFLHSYANPAHEQRIGDLLQRAMPSLAITLSSEVCPEVREYERLCTTCANAYVQPLMAGYLTALQGNLEAQGMRAPMLLMTSGGGLITIETAKRAPIRLVESGPAGGAILAAQIAAGCEIDKAMSFDMGGTTAKICLIENAQPMTSRSFEVDRAARFLKGSGLPLRIPVIEMIEIGAGGGSIAKLDGLGQIAVGPESAGADPGPACYGRDGQDATVTDANVVLGKIAPEHFAGGKVPILPERAAEALDESIGGRLGMATQLAAFGVTEMVDENMANAARVHAIESGKVIGDHTIIAFGGGAPLHAGRLAEKLGISRIIVPTEAGVGSAVGFLRAPVAFETVRSRYMTLRDFDPKAANGVLQAMQDEARQVVDAGAPGAAVSVRRSAYMRYEGQGHEIVVDVPDRPLTLQDTDFLKEAFDAEYSRLYARNIPEAEIEILTWAVVVSKTVKKPKPVRPPVQTEIRVASQIREIYDPEQGEYISVSFFWRPELKPGDRIKGPALIAEEETSTLVATEFDATILGNGFIDIRRRTEEKSP